MGTGGPMTEAMYYALLALTVPSHGYQLMSAVARASRGRVQMGPGTLYGVLNRMENEKLIEIVQDDGRRKTYAVTAAGRAALVRPICISYPSKGRPLRGANSPSKPQNRPCTRRLCFCSPKTVSASIKPRPLASPPSSTP